MVVAIKSFADLRIAGVQVVTKANETVETPVLAKPVAKAKTGVQRQPVRSIVEQPAKPVLELKGDTPELALGKVSAIAHAIYEARGFPNMFPFADHIINCLMHAAIRNEPNLPAEKRALRAIEHIVQECGVGGNRRIWATRMRSMFTILDETPAVDADGNLMGIDRSSAVPVAVIVDNVKKAASAREFYELYQPVDDRNFGRLETAHIHKETSLRTPAILHMRQTVPDFGLALSLSALQITGFGRRNNHPVANLARSNHPLILYIQNLVMSLQGMVSTDDEFLRGEILVSFIEGENALELDEFIQLHNDLKPIRVAGNASSEERQLARATYNANRVLYDARQAEWALLQKELNVIQQEAVEAVETVLAYIRFKREEKSYARMLEEQQTAKLKGASAPSDETPVGRTVSAIRPTTKADYKSSAYTPSEAVEAAKATSAEIETDITIPKFNMSALEMTEVSRKRVFEAAGIDGPRELSSVYPGVIWEAVVGPIDHLMDIDRTESDTRMVVIAPRRVGGMGLDMAEVRVLMVSEYEEYFKPVN